MAESLKWMRFLPSKGVKVKCIEFHTVHPWLAIADKTNNITVWDFESEQVPPLSPTMFTSAELAGTILTATTWQSGAAQTVEAHLTRAVCSWCMKRRWVPRMMRHTRTRCYSAPRRRTPTTSGRCSARSVTTLCVEKDRRDSVQPMTMVTLPVHIARNVSA